MSLPVLSCDPEVKQEVKKCSPFTQKIRRLTTYNRLISLISWVRPTLNLPRISSQNSVTCNGEYRRPFIKAQPSFHHVEVDGACTSNILPIGVIFSTLKHTDPHTVRSRSTQKDGVCNKHIFRNGSLRELKIAKESNDLADLVKARLTRIIP